MRRSNVPEFGLLTQRYEQGVLDGQQGVGKRWEYAHSTEQEASLRQCYHDGYAAGSARRVMAENRARLEASGNVPKIPYMAICEPSFQSQLSTKEHHMLEQKIDELKASIDTLNETLRAGMAQAAGAADKPAEKPAGRGKAKPKEEPKEEPAAPTITYEELRAKLIEVSQTKGDKVLVALIGEFGAKSGKEIRQNDYPDVLKRAEEILAEGDGSDLL